MGWKIPILGDLINLGSTYIQGKNKIAQADADANAEIKKKAATSLIDWETLHAKGAQTSWKDEYWTIVLSIPMILCFFPDMVEHVNAGFEALSNTPEWYRKAIMMLIMASLGIRYSGKAGSGIVNAVVKMKALNK